MELKELLNEEENLRTKLKPIGDQRTEIARLMAERDSLNAKVRGLRDQTNELKKERDSHNIVVRQEKSKRDFLNDQITKLKKQITAIFGGTEDEREYRRLRTEVKKLRWKVETSGVDYEEEKKLRGKLEKLEAGYKELEERERARSTLKQANYKAKEHHAKVISYAQQSEKKHQELVKFYNEMDSLKAKANSKHEEVLSAREKLKELESMRLADIRRLRDIKADITQARESQEKTLERKLEKTFGKRALEAQKKFKAGEKVDLRDLQIGLSLKKEPKKK